jgi:alkylation response protein AidB-like acyl-CoA dehydrogenase
MILDAESRQLLQDSARDWLLEKSPVSHFRALRDSQDLVCGDEIWRGMVEMGWQSIMVPENNGGSGLGMAELGVILEQSGRNLTPSPLLSTSLIAVTALTLCEQTEYCREVLEAIADGNKKVALAVDETRHHKPATVTTVAKREGDGWLLAGQKLSVADAVSADALLVSARVEGADTIDLFLVDSAAVVINPLRLIDSRDHGTLLCDNVSVSDEARLTSINKQYCLLDQVLDRARIGLSAEMLGSAWAAFELTIEYLKIREQFGQLIGSFQALQHRAAKMYVDLELARSVVNAALIAVDENDPDVPALACKAKAMAGDVLHLVSNEAIQLHGGIGMTDEHDSGLFLKRARVTEYLYGSSAFLRDRFASIRGF